MRSKAMKGIALIYSEDINYSYTFRGSGCGRYVGGMWAVQELI